MSVLHEAFASCLGHMWAMNCDNRIGAVRVQASPGQLQNSKIRRIMLTKYVPSLCHPTIHTSLINPRISASHPTQITTKLAVKLSSLMQGPDHHSHTHTHLWIESHQWASLLPGTIQSQPPVNPTWQIQSNLSHNHLSLWKTTTSSYLSSYPGYLWKPHWKSMELPEISRVTWHVRTLWKYYLIRYMIEFLLSFVFSYFCCCFIVFVLLMFCFSISSSRNRFVTILKTATIAEKAWLFL